VKGLINNLERPVELSCRSIGRRQGIEQPWVFTSCERHCALSQANGLMCVGKPPL
jgi:hypothetical protein